jgi:adenosylcobinamide-GDP ribazoletransferase
VRAAVAFLTPFGGARTPNASTLDWFPLVGAGLGLALGGVWWVAIRVWTSPVAAVLVVVADLGLTGLLHFDGLIDSADGLLPPLAPARRLEVMADPHAGAFGVVAAAAVLLARWASLAALRPGVLLLAGLWCFSRTAMAVVARTQPYVRGGGGLAISFGVGPGPIGGGAATNSATPFENPTGRVRRNRRERAGRGIRAWLPLGAGLVLTAVLLGFWRPGPGAAAGGAAALVVVAVVALARRRIGGYTGDVLGACGVLAESAGLMVAAARW